MKVAVLVSGGVDSSLALKLLQEQGHEVTAFYLKIWLEKELEFLGACPWEEDLYYVEALCKQAHVPLQVISLQKEYWEQVVAYTIAQARMGNTPNPDVLCNQRIKFGVFYDKIDASYDKVATGHYARVDGMCLKMSQDPVKDQTYFLAHLSQQQLARALFPLGNLTKVQVRQLASQYNLPSKDRKDSQGVCFLGQIKFSEFLRYHLGVKEGDLVEVETGKKVGKHEGFWYYTIGQRKGIGLSGGPWYVVSKDVEKNIVYISRNYYEPCRLRNQFRMDQCHWISGIVPEKKNLRVKIRHGELLYDAVVDSGLVTLQAQDQGIAPGQFAVLYDQDTCLGCGVIQVE